MAGDPAFLFYSSDFLTGVSDLTFEERGQYITLLCMQHQKGHLSGKAVAIAVPNATADVLAKFSIDHDGKYFNKRLELEAKKRTEYAAKQKQRAIDGWKKRKKKQSDIKENGNAAALPIENVNENRDINVLNAFKENVIETAKELSYPQSIFIPFLEHWTERDFESKCYAWQVPETFVIKSRLKGWKKNDAKNKVEHNDIKKLLI